MSNDFCHELENALGSIPEMYRGKCFVRKITRREVNRQRWTFLKFPRSWGSKVFKVVRIHRWRNTEEVGIAVNAGNGVFYLYQ